MSKVIVPDTPDKRNQNQHSNEFYAVVEKTLQAWRPQFLHFCASFRAQETLECCGCTLSEKPITAQSNKGEVQTYTPGPAQT